MLRADSNMPWRGHPYLMACFDNSSWLRNKEMANNSNNKFNMWGPAKVNRILRRRSLSRSRSLARGPIFSRGKWKSRNLMTMKMASIWWRWPGKMSERDRRRWRGPRKVTRRRGKSTSAWKSCWIRWLRSYLQCCPLQRRPEVVKVSVQLWGMLTQKYIWSIPRQLHHS